MAFNFKIGPLALSLGKAAPVALASKGGGNFGQGVPAFWFARAIEIGGDSQNLYRPYADSVWVQAAIKQVSGPISSVAVNVTAAGALPVKHAKRGYYKAGATAVNDAQVAEWLQEPSPGLGWEDFVQASIGFLKMSECFWVLDESKPFPEVGALPQIKFARPDRMRPVIVAGEIVGWQYTPIHGVPETLLPEQVIRLFNWNPYDDWRGLGEYQSAQIAAEADWMAGKFARNLMANNGDLGGIIIAKGGVPTDPQREQIISQLREKRAAQLRGELRYTFMTGDVDVKDPKITSVDAPFISQRLENRHEIAAAFGVPMSMFDVTASYSIGSASDYYRLIMDTCIPAGAKLCMALKHFFRRAAKRNVDVSLDWDEHPVMQAVRRERLAAADGLFAKGMPMQQINDYLGLELPAYKDWDKGYLPVNVTEVGAPEAAPMQPDDYNETAPEDDDTTPKAVSSLLKFLGPGRVGLIPNFKSANHKLWETHMKLRAKGVKMLQSRASRVIHAYRIIALRKMAGLGSTKSLETKSLLDLIFDAASFGHSLKKQLEPVQRTVMETAAEELMSELGRDDDAWKLPPKDALEFLAGRSQSVQDCGETVRSQLNTALMEGVQGGETMQQLSDRVRGVFNNLESHEARRIAVTETGMAYNFTRHEGMKATGTKYKAWLSSHGPNVRPAHAEAEQTYLAEPIPLDQPFIVDGEELMYPGDEDGSPSNVINCNCIQLAKEGPDE